MGRWISCPPRSNADCLITLLFHSGGTITTDTFSWYFVHPQQKRKRYKLIVWRTNQSQSSSADGLMALMAVAGWSRETGWRLKRDWFKPQGAECMWVACKVTWFCFEGGGGEKCVWWSLAGPHDALLFLCYYKWLTTIASPMCVNQPPCC